MASVETFPRPMLFKQLDSGYSHQHLSWSQLNSSIKKSRTPFCYLITNSIRSWSVWKLQQKILYCQQRHWSGLERTSGYIVQIEKVSFLISRAWSEPDKDGTRKTVLSSRDSSFKKRFFISFNFLLDCCVMIQTAPTLVKKLVLIIRDFSNRRSFLLVLQFKQGRSLSCSFTFGNRIFFN